MGEINHYMLDFVEPDKRYSVAEYKKDAVNCIKEVLKKGKTPIVVRRDSDYI